jgi:hypothetical protein
MKNLFFAKNRSTRPKKAKFQKSRFQHPRRKKKSPISVKGLFRVIAAFLIFALANYRKLLPPMN